VVAAGANDNSIIWYKYPSWSKNYVTQNLSGAGGVYVADINNDDTLDIAAVGYTGFRVVWYEGPDWNEHIIDNSLSGPEMLLVVDIDNDNDSDIVVTSWDANQVVLYKQVPVNIEQNAEKIPNAFEVYPNYPNPFNPTTTITFDLLKSNEVSLKVFNILGEEMATLVSDRLPAGSYSFEWSRTSGIASGIYLYRLQAGDYFETRKMVLMR